MRVCRSIFNKMKLGVFGATGLTGVQLTQQALEKGYDVVALVRNPDGLKIDHEKLQKVKVNIMESSTMTPHIEGCDAIMSCLGANYMRKTPLHFYLESTQQIVEAMRGANVKKLIAITSWYTECVSGSPFLMEWLARPFMLKHLFEDMARMEHYLAGPECEDINYTVVRPPTLTDKEKTEKELKVGVDEQFLKKESQKMSRADVARFMLSCMENEEYNRKTVAITVAK